MSRFSKKQYMIDRPNISSLLVNAISMAGNEIQKRITAQEQIEEKLPYGLRWIKTELTYPSFEHFTFAYKNQIFPVFVELFENGISQMTKNERDRFLTVANQCHFIPCVYKVQIIRKKKSIWNFIKANNQKDDIVLEPMSAGWNLWDLRTGLEVNPLTLGDNQKIIMSEWETQGIAIQIVRDYLKKENYLIDSFCNLPEINPQIWFVDHSGYRCWLIVKSVNNYEDEDYHNWLGLEESIPGLKEYDGYFASVWLMPTSATSFPDPDSNKTWYPPPLYRGDGFFVRFNGLQRVYVSP